MKPTFQALVMVLGIGMLLPTPSPALGPNGSISLDGQLSRRITGRIGHNYGMGGSLQLEFQPVQAFSIGVGADLLDFVGINRPGQSFLESLNLVGRGIFNAGEAFQPYLMAGYGINPKIDLRGNFTWWGNYHIMGGLGAFYFFDPHWAVDTALAYNYFESGNDPLQTVNARLGFSFFFEPVLKKYSLTGEPVPASRIVAPASTQPASPASSASSPQTAVSVPVSGTASGAVAPLTSVPKTGPPAAAPAASGSRTAAGSEKTNGAQQKSAIGPKGLASFREPASDLKTKPSTPGPTMKPGTSTTVSQVAVQTPVSKTAAKTPLGQLAFRTPAAGPSSVAANEVENDLEETEEELEDDSNESSAPAPTVKSPVKGLKPPQKAPVSKKETPAAKPQAERQSLGVPSSKKEMGAPAAKPQAERQSLGVPSSKKEMGAPVATQAPGTPKQSAAKTTPQTPAAKNIPGQVAFRESTPVVKTPASKPATAVPTSKPASQSPAPKTPLGKVAYRETAPAPSIKTSPSAKASTFAEATPDMSGDKPEGPSKITTRKGQSLWDIASRKDVYGDPELYTLLVDANRKVLQPDQMTLKAGMKLAVPRGVSDEKIRQARINAWTNDYMRYRGIGLTKPAYQKWRKNKKDS